MRTQYPVTATNERPSYSNIAFTLMFMAVEAQTGKNYTQLVDEFIVQELGMTSTFPSPGDDDKAVIPPGESTWGGNYGFDAP
jgi:CubicO group peptidase (beta-lactamase class C family)